MANPVLQLLITARDSASEVVDRVRAGLGGIGSAANAALEPLRTFGGLLSAAIGIGGIKQVIDLADAYTRLTNAIRITTTNEVEYQSALSSVIKVSKESNADLDTTAQLYSKVSSSAKNLGLAQNEVADVTALISKAMQLSGAETGAANGAILQFTQALTSGVLRGEEFNSVMEASPAMMNAIAKGMGVAIGELRKMAEAGQLTSDVVVRALLSQRDAINEVYSKLPQTVSQGMQQLGNAATIFAGQLNEQTGATQALGSGLKFLGNNLDAVTALIGAGLTAATARGAAAMTGYVQASLAAAAASKEQAIAQAAAAAASIRDAESKVAAAQAAYNVALANQRQAQTVLTLMQANLGYGTSEADVAAARIAAANAANAATAATSRYSAAQAALSAIQVESAAATGLLSRAMGFLAGPGGLILLAVSAFGLLYSAFSKQKPVTDELTKSTDQYTESLKKLNELQLNAELIKFNSAIKEQQSVLNDAKTKVDNYKTGHIGLYEALTESKSRAELLTEAEGVQADAEAKLKQLQENRAAVVSALATKEQISIESNSALTTAYRQQSVAMDKVAVNYEAYEKYLKTVTSAKISETEATLEKAKAEQNSNEIDRLTLQLADQRATAAKVQAELLRGEATAAQLKVDALEKVKELTGSLTPMEAVSLQAARESAAAKNAEAAAAEALALKLQYQSDHTLKLHSSSLLLLEVMAKESEEAVKNATIKQAQIDASIALAKAKGDEAKAAQLVAEKSAQTLQDAQDEIDRNKERVAELDKVINQLYAEAQIKGMTTEQQKYIQGLMDEANERKRTVATLESKLPLMERELQQAQIMEGPIGELTRLYAEQAKEHERTAAASARYQDQLVKEAEGALKLAQINGDANEIAKAQTALNDQKIQQAQSLANTRAIELADSEKAVSAKVMEMAADGEWTKADQEAEAQLRATVAAKQDAVKAAQQNVEQLQKEKQATEEKAAADREAAEAAAAEKEAAEQRAAAGAAFTKVLSGWAQRLNELSPAARAAFDGFVQGADVAGMSIEQLTERTSKNMDEIAQIVQKSLGTGFMDWAGRVSIKALEIEQAFLSQKIAVEDAAQSLNDFAENGGSAAEAERLIAQYGEDANQELGLLDEQDLNNLQDAIDAANGKLKEMQQEAEDAQLALAEMNAELMAEAGDTAGADRLKLQIDQSQRLAELEQKRLEAEMEGNTAAAATYQEMINKLDELYALKSSNLEAELAAQAANNETNKSARSAASGVGELASELEKARDAALTLNQVGLSGLRSEVNSLTDEVYKLHGLL